MRLSVYDVLGKEVARLVNGYCEAGYQMAAWNGSAVGSGVYYARLTIANESGNVVFVKMSKLMLLK